MTKYTASAVREAMEVTTKHGFYRAWLEASKEIHWTSDIKKAVKKADYISFRFREVFGAPPWHREARWVDVSVCKRDHRNPDKQERIEFVIPGQVSNGHKDETEKRNMNSESSFGWVEYSSNEENIFAPLNGVWVVNIYPGQRTHAESIFSLLPVGSTLAVTADLDACSSPILAEKKLHGDLLKIHAVKGKKRLNFDLDSQISLHNSARFGNV